MLTITVMIIVMFVMIFLLTVIVPLGIGSGRRSPGSHFCRGAFDDLVQLTPIQPDTPALRAKINLDTLTFCNMQCDIASGTVHVSLLLSS